MARNPHSRIEMEYRLDFLDDVLNTRPLDVGETEDVRVRIGMTLTKFPSRFNIWLTLYVLRGELPTTTEIEDGVFALFYSGASAWLSKLEERPLKHQGLRFEVVRSETLVDVFHTANTSLTTGIQRVTLEVAKNWVSTQDVRLIAWSNDWEYFRPLRQSENAKFGAATTHSDESLIALVPLEGTYILPEIHADALRASRAAAFVEATGTAFHAIGYDCVPIASSETATVGMPHAFATYLDLLARGRSIAAISDAAAADFSGWRKALSVTGVSGPEVVAISLAAEVTEPSPEQIEDFWRSSGLNRNVPVVTCVGSHEPRKNQLALLRAADRLWAEGHEFQLVLIGGNAWGSEFFGLRIEELRAKQRPVSLFSKVPDSFMHSATKVARFSAFPSLNEGFGLPVAESILLGTPVLTSNFGSMRHIAEGFGGELVDPRDDESIVNAMRQLLADPALIDVLRSQTQQFRKKSWPEYAAELFDYFRT